MIQKYTIAARIKNITKKLIDSLSQKDTCWKKFQNQLAPIPQPY